MLKICPLIQVAVLIVSCGCGAVQNKTDVTAVESDIRAHLPIGSSRAEVVAYLDRRKIPHGYVQMPEFPSEGKVVLRDTHTEQALIRDVRMRGMTRTDIQIEFKFDDSDSKLVNFSLREVYTGP